MRARKQMRYHKISYAGVGCYLQIRSPVLERDRSRSCCFPSWVLQTLYSRPTSTSEKEKTKISSAKACGLEGKGEREELGSSITKENYCSICRSHFFTTNHPAAIYIQRLHLLILFSKRSITEMLLLKKVFSSTHAFFQYISTFSSRKRRHR